MYCVYLLIIITYQNSEMFMHKITIIYFICHNVLKESKSTIKKATKNISNSYINNKLNHIIRNNNSNNNKIGLCLLNEHYLKKFM